MDTDIQKMSIVELESLAYRQLVLIEQAQKNLGIINQELQKKSQNVAKQEIPKEVKPVEEIKNK